MSTAQPGTTDHGNPNLICSSTHWTTIVSFFLGNYVAHAATVVTSPGESLWSSVVAILLALTFPASGIIRGLTAIVRHAAFTSDPLQQATRAGALCMVVRNKDWLPRDGDKIDDMMPMASTIQASTLSAWLISNTAGKRYGLPDYYFKLKDEVSFDENERIEDVKQLNFHMYRPPWTFPHSAFLLADTLSGFVDKEKKIHGFYQLDEGYSFAHVPQDAIVTRSLDTTRSNPKNYVLSNNYSAAKAVVAVIQLCIACFGIARNASSEIRDNGYGSFTLTVVPYALMSLVNLIGILVNPSYPALYMVSSDVMDEAKGRGSVFDGVVGRLVRDACTIEGIDDNQVSGTFAVQTEVKHITHHFFPEGWERRHDENGTTYYVDHLQKVTTRTPPPLDIVSREEKKLTVTLTLDCAPKPNAIAWLAARIQTMGYNAFEQAIDGGGTKSRLNGADKLVYDIGWSNDKVGDEASIFIPLCSSFKRQGRLEYTVEYDRLIPHRKWSFHFYGEHANLRHAIAGYTVQFSGYLVGGLSVAIIAAFTHFRAGSSPLAARVIFMIWLGVGILFGSGMHNVVDLMQQRRGWGFILIYGLIVWAIPAAVGFYEVVVRMRQYGTCIFLPE